MFQTKKTIYASDPSKEFVILEGEGNDRPLLVSRSGWVAWGSADRDSGEDLEFLTEDQVEELLPQIRAGMSLPETADKIRSLFADSPTADGDAPF